MVGRDGRVGRWEIAVVLFILWACLGGFVFAQEPVAPVAPVARAASTNEAVCKVWKGSSRGSGTLVGVSADGRTAIIVTAYHVAGSSGRASVYFENVPLIAGVKYPGNVFRGNARSDLSAIIIASPGVAPVVVGDLTRYDANLKYYACGYGSGMKYGAWVGRITSANGYEVLIDSPIIPGVSGGALFDAEGYYCGVTNARRAYGRNNKNWMHTVADASYALNKFLAETEQQCGIFFNRKKNNGGGGSAAPMPQCGPNGCPPAVGAPSLGGYQPLTPLAIPGATPAAPAIAAAPVPVPGIGVTIGGVPVAQATPAPTPPAPIPATLPTALPVASPVTITPTTDIDRLAARLSAMEGSLGAISKAVGVEEPQANDAGAMMARIPTVVVEVQYHDRTEKATFDLKRDVIEKLSGQQP